MRDVVEKIDGGWRIPLDGFVADRAQGVGNASLRLVNGDAEAFITVPIETVPEIEALAAARAVVATASASLDSTLTVEFEGGLVLSIPAIPDYENWEVNGPGKILVVGMPDADEPAISDATSESRTFRADEFPRVLKGILDSITPQKTEGEDE